MDNSNQKPINIALVDDHKIIREGLKAIFIAHPQYSIVYEAYSGENLKETYNGADIDLVLLDIVLPDVSGIELIPFFKANSQTKVIMLTAEMDEDIVCSAVSNGADGFLNKEASSNELMLAIKTVLEGEPYFGRSLSSIVFRSYKKKIQELNEAHNMPAISDREKEIIQLLSDGLSFKEMGDKLFISPRTVENHKNNLLQKLELRNTMELVKYAIRQKIVEI